MNQGVLDLTCEEDGVVSEKFGGSTCPDRIRTDGDNEYIGIFACDSWSFAPALFPNAPSLFAVQEGAGEPEEEGLNLFLALYAAYDLIEHLASTQRVDVDRAREAAQKGLMRLKPEEADIIRVESPPRARGY